MTTVGDQGEFALVAEIAARFVQGDHVVLGPGDDAAAIRVPSAVAVVSVDLLVQDRHFRLDWSSAADVGHKAAAESLSDVNAMGGLATTLVVGLGLPAGTPSAWALEFADGLAEEAALAGASVVGGDLTASDAIVVSVTSIGECPHGIVGRAGARPGNVVAHLGRQGWADAGYAVLARGFRSPRAVVEAHRRPQPPYGGGAAAAAAGATSMIDVSDGFLQDVGHLAARGSVTIDIDSASLDVPDPVQAVGAAMGIDPVRMVLTGGDDYGLVATFPAGAGLPDGWRVVGRVVGGDAGVVTVDGAPYPEASGHQHFR